MMVLNVVSTSDDWRARIISNFARTPFSLDGEHFASVEGFVQAIKFPEGNLQREWASEASSSRARRLGKTAIRDFVYWKGEKIPYGSQQHHRLIERAIEAKFRSNEFARNALLSTEGLELAHDTGHPESPCTSLPASVFLGMLQKVRDSYL